MTRKTATEVHHFRFVSNYSSFPTLTCCHIKNVVKQNILKDPNLTKNTDVQFITAQRQTALCILRCKKKKKVT